MVLLKAWHGTISNPELEQYCSEYDCLLYNTLYEIGEKPFNNIQLTILHYAACHLKGLNLLSVRHD